MSFRHSTRVTGSASAGISTSAARRHPTGFPTSYSGHYSPHAFQVLPPTGIAQATSLAQGPVQFLAGYRLALGQRLSASTSSVTEVIQRHGGEVIDAQLSANITVLVAAPEDVAEVTEPVSICNGLGVLIVREDWLKFSINSGRALPFHQFIYIGVGPAAAAVPPGQPVREVHLVVTVDCLYRRLASDFGAGEARRLNEDLNVFLANLPAGADQSPYIQHTIALLRAPTSPEDRPRRLSEITRMFDAFRRSVDPSAPELVLRMGPATAPVSSPDVLAGFSAAVAGVSVSGATADSGGVVTPTVPLSAPASNQSATQQVQPQQGLDFLTADMQISLSEITLGKEIGRGFFGVVHKGTWLGQTVAIKKIYRSMPTGQMDLFAREIRILSSLRSPYIVLFSGICPTSSDILLVTEFLDRGSLHDALTSPDAQQLTMLQRVQMIRDVCRGLLYLHGRKPPVIHRDLTSLNILVTQDWHCKVADFGMSRMKDAVQQMTKQPGNLRWMAPEVMLRQPYDERSDIYSFSLIAWEVCTGQIPLADLAPEQAAAEMAYREARPAEPTPEQCPPQLLSIIQECWAQDPQRRPSLDDVLRRLDTLATALGGGGTAGEDDVPPPPSSAGSARPPAAEYVDLPRHDSGSAIGSNSSISPVTAPPLPAFQRAEAVSPAPPPPSSTGSVGSLSRPASQPSLPPFAPGPTGSVSSLGSRGSIASEIIAMTQTPPTPLSTPPVAVAAVPPPPQPPQVVITAELFQKSQRGDPQAMFEVGMAYERGAGVVRDPQKAVKLYRDAAKKRHAPSIQALKRLGVGEDDDCVVQ